MEYRRRSLMSDPLDIDEQYMEKTHHTGTAFSYHESIKEFNQYRYGGMSYSLYHLWNHLFHLICSCRRTK